MRRKLKTKTVNGLLLSSIPLLVLLFFTGIPENSIAQQLTPAVVSSGGETFTGNGLSLDFTVGEIMTESISTTGLLLTQGFLQGPDRNTGIEENLIDEKDIVVYPNPAANQLYILYNDQDTRPVSADIKDLQGRLVLRTDGGINPLYLNLEKLTPGFYTVSILFENHQIINKKIIKQ
jgi:hypothetical protein